MSRGSCRGAGLFLGVSLHSSFSLVVAFGVVGDARDGMCGGAGLFRDGALGVVVVGVP